MSAPITTVDVRVVVVPDIRLKWNDQLPEFEPVINLVRVVDAEGREGYASTWLPGGRHEVADAIAQYIRPIVVGRDVTEREALWQSIQQLGYFTSIRSAASAIDIALWDLAAKSVDLPLYQLLGAIHFVLPVKAFESETSREPAVLCLLEQRAVRERLVVKDGADLVYALEALDLFMPVVGVIEVVLDAADEWIDKILKATRNTRIVPPRTNIYLFLDDRKYSFVDRLFLEDRGKRNSVAP